MDLQYVAFGTVKSLAHALKSWTIHDNKRHSYAFTATRHTKSCWHYEGNPQLHTNCDFRDTNCVLT